MGSTGIVYSQVVHSYTLTVGSAELTFIITIERAAAHLSEHYFFLSMKIGAVERPISQSVTLTLTIDPRDLTFAVFAFPPKPCMPQGCLYSLRVWLRANGVDHRIFSEDALWVGADPDFYSIENAAFARPRSVGATVHVYQVAIGKTLVDLVIRWRRVMEKAFSISLEYEARGVGRILFENLTVRLDCSPQEIDFVIYTMPISSTPQGASHRLRLWLRGPRQSSGPPYRPVDGRSASSVCQRIWSTDDFKLGDMLDFTALGPKLIMGVPTLNDFAKTPAAKILCSIE
ncbi:hypothetical protein BV25DRAFT_1866539 [Artomyces pyxidatus]|uniref:Uncharacterized protein n=1 Tax=Artomyces pyxidatus TaxID=48021 RepID=A0ACB8TJH5_9AGAM|nr:hypothetical protein BV25DRAFT_1866539 [Artomyces pyxidatus]